MKEFKFTYKIFAEDSVCLITDKEDVNAEAIVLNRLKQKYPECVVKVQPSITRELTPLQDAGVGPKLTQALNSRMIYAIEQIETNQRTVMRTRGVGPKVFQKLLDKSRDAIPCTSHVQLVMMEGKND